MEGLCIEADLRGAVKSINPQAGYFKNSGPEKDRKFVD
jgi:hypothetical protein